MTYDELLAYINEEIEVCDPSCNSHKADNQPWLALRAVVELHKPFEKTIEETTYLFCAKCTDLANRQMNYPCEDIQAIEKELK